MSEFVVGEMVLFSDGRKGVIESFFEAVTIRDTNGHEHKSPVDELVKIHTSLEKGERVRVYSQIGVVVSGPFRSPGYDDRYVIRLDDGSHVLHPVTSIKRVK